MTPTIYRIEFPDGKFYIGATQNFANRKSAHQRDARRGTASNTRMKAAFVEHGTFRMVPVASGLSVEHLHELEGEIIRQDKPDLNIMLTPQPLPASPRARLVDARAGCPPSSDPTTPCARQPAPWGLRRRHCAECGTR